MIATITYLFVNATSQGMQIILSRYLGAGEIDLAKKLVVKTMITSIIVSTIMAIMMAIFSEQIFGIFTNNKDVIKLCKYIMLVEIALELGRAVNMVLVRALQTSGDVMYPTILAIICCWLIATLLSYILGLRLEYGLVGIWIAMAMDELIRACLFIVRFIRGKWLKIKIVNS